MKNFILLTCALAWVLACSACAKKITTLSDGQPGYAINCETVKSRCYREIELLCKGGGGYEIVSERAQEVSLPIEWADTGAVLSKFNSRYWMEVRCAEASAPAGAQPVGQTQTQ